MFVFIIAALFILANSWHVLTAWFLQPQGTYFTGIAHYYADYFLYTSLMAQKTWLYTEHLFTNEPLPPTWIYWLYTLIGKLGNPFVLYNVSIVIFSVLVLYLWWILIKQTSKHPPIAFLFLVTASGFTQFWFSPFPSLNRLGGVPHQIFQTIVLLGMILAKPPALFILSFFSAITNPIQTLIVSIALIMTKPKNLLYLLPAIVGAALTNTTFSHDPILTAAKTWENSQNLSISVWQFILAIGPITLIVPFGVKPYFKTLTPIKKTVAWYGILSIIIFFSPIPTLLSTSPVRWLSPAAYTILPILAADGLKKYTVPILILFTIITIPSIQNQIIARQNAPRELLYVPNDVVRNLHNLQGDGVVLTNPTKPYDVLIPVFTGRKTFTGHPIHTLYPNVKEALRNKYFEGKMTEEEKQQFLKDHNITMIFEL